jgi:phage tail sheath protein FI
MTIGLAVVAVRAKKAQQVYGREVRTGARPIEAVGTAIAAFVGIDPGGPINSGAGGAVHDFE